MTLDLEKMPAFISGIQDFSANYLSTDWKTLRSDTQKKVIALRVQINELYPLINQDKGEMFREASRHKKISVLNFLIEQGEALNRPDSTGNMPLHHVILQIDGSKAEEDHALRTGFFNALKKIILRILSDGTLSIHSLLTAPNTAGETPMDLIQACDKDAQAEIKKMFDETKVDYQALVQADDASEGVASASENESRPTNDEVCYHVGARTFTLQELIDAFDQTQEQNAVLETRLLESEQKFEEWVAASQYDPKLIELYEELYNRDRGLMLLRLKKDMTLRKSPSTSAPSTAISKPQSDVTQHEWGQQAKVDRETRRDEKAVADDYDRNRALFEKKYLKEVEINRSMKEKLRKLAAELNDKEKLVQSMTEASNQMGRLHADLADVSPVLKPRAVSRQSRFDQSFEERMCLVCQGGSSTRGKRARAALEEYIIHHGPNLVDADGNTGLHLAAMNRKKDILKLLLLYGANVKSLNAAGETALDLLEVDALEERKMLENPLVHTLVYQLITTLSGFTDVEESAAATAVRRLPDDFDVDAVDENGRTFLHYAAAANCDSVITELVRRGANVDAEVPIIGVTPLHLAMMEGGKKKQEQWEKLRNAVKALLEEGADPKLKTGYHTTPEEYARTVDNAREDGLERGRSSSVGRKIKRSLSRGNRQGKERGRKTEQIDDSLTALFVNIKDLVVSESRLKKLIKKIVELGRLHQQLIKATESNDEDWGKIEKMYQRYRKVLHIFNPGVKTEKTVEINQKVLAKDINFLDAHLERSPRSLKSSPSREFETPGGGRKKKGRVMRELHQFLDLLRWCTHAVQAEDFCVSEENLQQAYERFPRVANQLFFDAIAKKDTGTSTFLLDSKDFRGITPSVIDAESGRPCAFFAAEHGEIYLLYHLLKKNPALLDVPDAGGRFLEMVACDGQNPQPLLYVIQKRADSAFDLSRVGILRDRGGNSIFHLAAATGDPKIMGTAMTVFKTPSLPLFRCYYDLLFKKNAADQTATDILDEALSDKSLPNHLRLQFGKCKSILTTPQNSPEPPEDLTPPNIDHSTASTSSFSDIREDDH